MFLGLFKSTGHTGKRYPSSDCHVNILIAISASSTKDCTSFVPVILYSVISAHHSQDCSIAACDSASADGDAELVSQPKSSDRTGFTSSNHWYLLLDDANKSNSSMLCNLDKRDTVVSETDYES